MQKKRITTTTPVLLSTKHPNFGQGLEFLKFGQGNRGLNQQHRRQTKETVEKTKESKCTSVRKIDTETLMSCSLMSYLICLVHYDYDDDDYYNDDDRSYKGVWVPLTPHFFAEDFL